MTKFKIDLSESTSGSRWPVALFVRRRCWHTWFTNIVWWERLSIWETRDEAFEAYNKVKSLPEYLD